LGQALEQLGQALERLENGNDQIDKDPGELGIVQIVYQCIQIFIFRTI
jgi:hypothetical protein